MAGLDDLLGGILGGQAQPGADAPAGGRNPADMAQGLNQVMMIVGPILAMMARNGGLQDLLGKLSGAGLGTQGSSWVGTGDNEPVSAEQVAAALPDEVSSIAQQAGLAPEQVSEGLAQLLPGLVDGVTPDGQIPEQAVDVAGLLGQIPGGDQLKSMLGL